MITRVQQFSLRPFNTFRMDVKCGEWIEYTSPHDLPSIFASLGHQRHKHIGAGSNLLFLGDYSGVVLHSRILDLEFIQDKDSDCVLVRSGAGVEMDSLIEKCTVSGLWGAENLSGIPGEVGAAAVQNVGAYGVEAADIIRTVECYDTMSNRFVSFAVDDCSYGYRESMFKRPENQGRYVVTYVTLALNRKPHPKLDYGNLKEQLKDIAIFLPMDVRKAVIGIRDEKLPSVAEVGSAGSFFKNPVISADELRSLTEEANRANLGDVPYYNMDGNFKVPAAWLIDKAGLKGIRNENAGLWHRQPLVIANLSGRATPDEIVELESQIRHTVKSRFGIELEPEVEHII